MTELILNAFILCRDVAFITFQILGNIISQEKIPSRYNNNNFKKAKLFLVLLENICSKLIFFPKQKAKGTA